MKELSYSEFMAAVKETKSYRSSANKEYRVTRVTKNEIDLRDQRTKVVFTVDPQQVYAALAENGAAGCTVPCLKMYVGAKAAPASAALIYRVAGGGRFYAQMDKLVDIVKTMMRGSKPQGPRTYMGVKLASDYLTYEKMLEKRNKDVLIADISTFGLPYKSVQLEHYTKARLCAILVDHVKNHTADWIENLPVEDLKMLELIIQNEGYCTHPVTPQLLILESLGLVETKTPSFEDVNLEVASICKGLLPLFTPYVQEAIQKKCARHEELMEKVFQGLINRAGVLEIEVAKEAMHKLFEESDVKVKPEDLDHFFHHSMLVREAGYMDELGDSALLTSTLVQIKHWFSEVDPMLAPRIPENLQEAMNYGSYPFFKPYTETEQRFYDLFAQNDLCKNLVDNYYMYFYTRVQDHSYEPEQAKDDVLRFLQPKTKKEVEQVMMVFIDFWNEVPRFENRGHSAAQEYARQAEASKPYVAPKKVGRNDPCPCGSGKKYKNCCGKN